MKILIFLAHNPRVNLLAGLVLMLTAVYEIVIAVEETALHSEYGLVVYGFTHMLKVLPELVHGAEKLAK